jgi:hypothetical protein
MAIEQLVYTDRSRGKGLDPNAAGYQAAACSAGVTAEIRRVLTPICLHYGDAVYRHAPRTALDRETAWRTTRAASVASMPVEILRAFPEAWSYDQIAEDVFALTRVRYSGFTHDGRTGNFVAHALMFQPDDLAACGHNPLSLARSTLFVDQLDGDQTRLPAIAVLPALSSVRGGVPETAHAAPVPHVAALVSALMSCDTSRPMLLRLNEGMDAAAALEMLLELIPPGARARTTFATFENDWRWMPSMTRSKQTDGGIAAHQLIAVASTDGRDIDVRAGDAQSAGSVFDFVRGTSSTIATPRPYAQFVAQGVTEGAWPRVANYQQRIERLGLGRSREAWDRLLPLAALDDVLVSGRGVAEAARLLSGAARLAPQAKAALHILWPHVRRLYDAGEVSLLDTIATDVGTLADCASSDVDAEQELLPQIESQALAALTDGRIRLAVTLLNVQGRNRGRALLSLLHRAMSDPANVVTVRDAERLPLMNLLAEGLQLASASTSTSTSTSAPAGSFEALLIWYMQTAREAGRLTEAWHQMGDAIIKPLFRPPWRPDRTCLARDLLSIATPDACPPLAVWLNLQILDLDPPNLPETMARLEQCAKVCGRCPDADEIARGLVRRATERFKDATMRAEVLGRLAQAAFDSGPGPFLLDSYRAVMSLDAVAVPRVRTKLADVGAGRVLCVEMLDEVLPHIDTPLGRARIDAWCEAVFDDRTEAFGEVCRELSMQLGRDRERSLQLLQVALALFRHVPDYLRGDSRYTSLCAAVMMLLPMAPLMDPWASALPVSLNVGSTDSVSTDFAESEAAVRLDVLRFMTDQAARSLLPAWSAAEFEHGDPRWHRVTQLPPSAKADALAWAATAFNETGLSTPDDSHVFERILRAAGASSTEVATAAAELLKGRDAVTCVQAVMAFVVRRLDDPADAADTRDWHLVETLVQCLAADVRPLLDDHLERRFARITPQYERRLAALQTVLALGPRKQLPRTQVPIATHRPDSSSDRLGQKARSLLGRIWKQSAE